MSLQKEGKDTEEGHVITAKTLELQDAAVRPETPRTAGDRQKIGQAVRFLKTS